VKNHLKKFLGNSKGQVAIFVALIFQVLFVFFAMIVNVGLLVHHKINLQNSVDLAAYYGAMKQAEMLNAIAHVNYQIRQSHKLLTFRYQQLGTAGLTGRSDNNHPYQNQSGAGTLVNDVHDQAYPPISTAGKGTDPTFCLPYSPIDLARDPSETYCKRSLEDYFLPLPAVPENPSGGNDALGLGGFFNAARAAAQQAIQQAQQACVWAMNGNWFQLMKFVFSYKNDIRNRKKLLLGLANEVSKEDPRDIDNQLIREGVYNTFYRNLTDPNKGGFAKQFGSNPQQGFEFKVYNSFSHPNCRGPNVSNISPPSWLSEILVFMNYRFVNGRCNTPNGSQIDFAVDDLNLGSGNITSILPANITPANQGVAIDLVNYAREQASFDANARLFRSSLGFEKDPWCVGYWGVSATTTPAIPFSPFGSVKLQAVAYAKPFGGRVGPWYGTRWPASENSSVHTFSDPDSLVDRLAPARAGLANPYPQNSEIPILKQQARLYPNHSRYLGDTVGIMSRLDRGQYAQAIFQRINRLPLFAWYKHLESADLDQPGADGDMIAWDNDNNQSPPLRDMEIAAIAPNQFDTATYSIDPEYWLNYGSRIKRAYGSQFQFAIRGDLGSRMNGTDEQRNFSVKDQIQNIQSRNMVNVQSKLTYFLNDFAQLLTSWQQTSPDSYALDTSRFGRCETPIRRDEGEPFYASGFCKAGGRTGYSVKMVDGNFLSKTTQELGGQGQSGVIKNPPPPITSWQ
jgi:hypothetical protein